MGGGGVGWGGVGWGGVGWGGVGGVGWEGVGWGEGLTKCSYLRVLGDAVEGPGHGVARGVKASPEQGAQLGQQILIPQSPPCPGVLQAHQLSPNAAVFFTWRPSRLQLQHDHQQAQPTQSVMMMIIIIVKIIIYSPGWGARCDSSDLPGLKA